MDKKSRIASYWISPWHMDMRELRFWKILIILFVEAESLNAPDLQGDLPQNKAEIPTKNKAKVKGF